MGDRCLGYFCILDPLQCSFFIAITQLTLSEAPEEDRRVMHDVLKEIGSSVR